MTDAPATAPTTAGGLGLATLIDGGADDGTVLDVWFPEPRLGDPVEDPALRERLEALAGRDDARRVRREVRAVTAALQEPATTTEDMWLRLHLLSHRLVRPHTIVMDGIFGLLTNVVWTCAGPCPVDGIRADPAPAAARPVSVDGLRRRQVPPDGRLRRYRAASGSPTPTGSAWAPTWRPGTTVMHEGFVNFNAGTLGTSMVEGRISAGVVVGDGSDIGGGASIMGTLSGGGKQVVSIGERCLLGANGGIGISLGDDCVVEAGCYVTAGTKVTLPDGGVVKARELSGAARVLFRRNSVTGAVEARPWKAGRHHAQRRPARQLTGESARDPAPAWRSSLVAALGLRRPRRRSSPWRGGSLPPLIPRREECQARSTATVELDLEQAESAAMIAGVSVRRGLPARAATIALATAYQESDYATWRTATATRVGLFQQRPSQGWGTPDQLQDPHYAAGTFYDALAKVKNYESLPVTVAAEEVQRCAFPKAYADHEQDARVLASALTGQSRAASGAR